MIDYCFMSRLKFFHSYVEVTVAGEGLYKIETYTCMLGA
jgi:hypothetical protein